MKQKNKCEDEPGLVSTDEKDSDNDDAEYPVYL